ncbi:hypothetical protein XENORESO_015931 [Xenotaenia resolanae]|uniref:Uncharacterized protein n=1 Tax=Xenotaenia resolanae TaxID=208358 RepID=A0ABV0WVB6_9TELE
MVVLLKHPTVPKFKPTSFVFEVKLENCGTVLYLYSVPLCNVRVSQESETAPQDYAATTMLDSRHCSKITQSLSGVTIKHCSRKHLLCSCLKVSFLYSWV